MTRRRKRVTRKQHEFPGGRYWAAYQGSTEQYLREYFAKRAGFLRPTTYLIGNREVVV